MASRTKSSFELGRSFTYQLHALGKLTDRASHAAYLDQTGLTLSEARALAAIGAFRPLSVVDLAQRANLNKSQASRAAQTLVEQSLVVKQANAQDGRGVVLNLTAKGEKLWSRVMEVVECRNQDILACLQERERQSLLDMLSRLVEAARERDDDPEP